MINDPRENITHEFEIGQVYKDARTGEPLQLCYIHSEAVLLRSKGDATNDSWTKHRVEPRKSFEQNVGAGRYKLQGEEEVDADVETFEKHEVVDFENIDRVGEKAAQALQSNGYTTKGDIKKATDEELLAVSYIGETNLANIREHVEA